MIDWDKVPEGELEGAKELEARLKNIEAGYVNDYINIVGCFSTMASLFLLKPDRVEKFIGRWEDQKDYLAKMYEEVGDFGGVERNRDTEAYFVCKERYEQGLLPALESFKGRVDEKKEVTRECKDIERIAKEMCEIGRTVSRGEVLHWLNRIPGCEGREIKGIWVPHKCCSNPDYKLKD